MLLLPLLVACTEPVPNVIQDSTGCIWRTQDTGSGWPDSVYGRALAGAGTLLVNPESGPRAGNSYTMRWDSGPSQDTEINDSGRIPLSLSDLEAGEQAGELLDRRGDVALTVNLTLVAPGEPAVICAGPVLADGSQQEPGDFDDPLTLRAWTQEAQGLELLLWIYEFDQGLFTSSSQTVAQHQELLTQDNVTATVTPSYPNDNNEIGGLEIGGVARLLDADGEQVGEDVGFPVDFER